jgi:hypothetical protein
MFAWLDWLLTSQSCVTRIWSRRIGSEKPLSGAVCDVPVLVVLRVRMRTLDPVCERVYAREEVSSSRILSPFERIHDMKGLSCPQQAVTMLRHWTTPSRMVLSVSWYVGSVVLVPFLIAVI